MSACLFQNHLDSFDSYDNPVKQKNLANVTNVQIRELELMEVRYCCWSMSQIWWLTSESCSNSSSQPSLLGYLFTNGLLIFLTKHFIFHHYSIDPKSPFLLLKYFPQDKARSLSSLYLFLFKYIVTTHIYGMVSHLSYDC